MRDIGFPLKRVLIQRLTPIINLMPIMLNQFDFYIITYTSCSLTDIIDGQTYVHVFIHLVSLHQSHLFKSKTASITIFE